MDDLICVLHEADVNAPTAPANTIVLGLAVCGECLNKILENYRRTDGRVRPYTADEYLLDAAQGGWF